MTENKRFQYNWKTKRMKDTQSNSLATSNMRVLETIINDACYSYEKRIKELEKEVESKQRVIDAYEQYVKDLKEKPKHMDQRPPNIFPMAGKPYIMRQ